MRGMLQRIFPSFTLVLTSRSESPALPDYYRPTKREDYGPQVRSRETMAFDTMRTLDERDVIHAYRSSAYLSDISEVGYEGDEEEEDSIVELDSVIYSYPPSECEKDYNLSMYSLPGRKTKLRKRYSLKCIKCLIAMIVKKCRPWRRREVVVRPASSLSIDLSN